MTVGFYGGKFLPMHKGHLYCIDTAARICDHLVVIMFINGDEELVALKKANGKDPSLFAESRALVTERICKLYLNTEFHIIDTLHMKREDGSEDWDAETPAVREYVPKMDYVFSSEERYSEYFARAYPEAKHIIVDSERKKYPISSTMIRAMNIMEERKKWLV